MSQSRAVGLRLRIPPILLAIVGGILVTALVITTTTPSPDPPPWWAVGLLIVPAAILFALGVGLAIDPRPLTSRRALAGAAMVWLFLLAPLALLMVLAVRPLDAVLAVGALAALDAAGLLGLAATTPDVAPEIGEATPLGRLGAVVAFAVSIVVASTTLVLAVVGAVGLWRALSEGRLPDRLPWGAFAAILVLPVITFVIAAVGARRAAGGTFQAQAAANQRNSLLLLVTLVAVVAATGEVIVGAVTLEPLPALWAAGFAAVIGLGAALGTDRFGSDLVLRSAGAVPADPTRDQVVLDVVHELSLAAGLEAPAVFLIADGSQNAFATGRDPRHASIVVTRGLVEQMDREELQGVIGHELGHVRNLDTRYALYVAVLVGLVALVTDGFLRLVVEAWRQGAFVWGGDSDDAKGAAAAFVSGIAVGLFLLVVAVVLRVVAPLFAAMVQAATSREREYLADATSVEFTRNPRGLERALEAIAADEDPLEAANRGTQHLWFRNPVRAGSDDRYAFLATHPSLRARVARLRRLQGLPPADRAALPLDAH